MGVPVAWWEFGGVMNVECREMKNESNVKLYRVVDDWQEYYDIGGVVYLGLFTEVKYRRGTTDVSRGAINKFENQLNAEWGAAYYRERGFKVKTICRAGVWKLYVSGKLNNSTASGNLPAHLRMWGNKCNLLWSTAEYTDEFCKMMVEKLRETGIFGDVCYRTCPGKYGRIYVTEKGVK